MAAFIKNLLRPTADISNNEGRESWRLHRELFLGHMDYEVYAQIIL